MPKVKKTSAGAEVKKSPIYREAESILKQAGLSEYIDEIKETKTKEEGEVYPTAFVTFAPPKDTVIDKRFSASAEEVVLMSFFIKWIEYRMNGKKNFKAKPTTLISVQVFEEDGKVIKRALKFLQLKVSDI
jgi:hypothetical protein